MNIAIFTDCYVPIKNGVVTSVRQLLEGLTKKGHNVYIITVDVPNYEEKDIRIYRLPSISASFGSETGTRLGFWINQGAIVRFLKKKNIEIIHTHTEAIIGYYGKMASKKLNIPCVHTTHTMWEEYRHYLMNGKLVSRNMLRKILKNFLKGIYTIVCPSIKAQNYYKDLYPEMPSVVINNGIDIKKFKSSVITNSEIEQIRNEFGLKKTDKILLFVGRIGKEKRVVELLNIVTPILQKNKHIKLIFTGAGPLIQELTELSEAKGIAKQVVFTGFVNWELVYRLYSISDIFVTASTSEVQSMTLIEALICGLPIVTRTDESYFDLVKNGINGYMCDTDSEMGEKIEYLLENDELRKQFANESLKLSENFTAENHVNKMEEFYKNVIENFNKNKKK